MGEFEVQVSMSGFQTLIHKGITLTVGAQPVVDFSLPVGQASQTVTVEAQVSQVETETATVSSLVSPRQMSNLPLNGRNFEQLLTLAPGVQTVPQTPGGGGSSATFYGEAANYSVSGSRPEGQSFLVDNQDLVDFWGHAAGSSVTGNSLGVEAIQEFQLLTSTYSAQFGGNGAVMNAVTKSGTNALHGSAYDYLRNSALDARNFFDLAQTPEYRRNQFGGSLGGPVKKNKVFFFVNYEGLRSSQGFTGLEYIPDADSIGIGSLAGEVPYVTGMVPCNTVSGQKPPSLGGTCNPGGRLPVAINPIMVPYVKTYPTPTVGAADQIVPVGVFNGYPSGNTLYPNVANQIVYENYVLGRIDYTLGARDSFFGRYASDTAYQNIPYPLSLLPNWPELTHSGDQFFTLEEKHLVSATAINEVRFSFSRTNERLFDSNATLPPSQDPMQFYPGSGRPDGQITISGGTSAIGGERYPFARFIENKVGAGDDLFWTHGAHSLKVGVSVERVQTNIGTGFFGGLFSFGSLPSFLGGVISLFQGEQNPSPTFTPNRYFRQTDYSPYIEDDWKVRRNLTLNFGVRYDFATNAACEGGVPCYAIQNPASSQSCPTWTTTYCGFTKVRHVLASNPNALNFDPRLGLAWDPFSDHKTSVRAGFGIFHEPIVARTFAAAYFLAPPSGAIVTPAVPFPYPGTASVPPSFGTTAGLYYGTSTSPYEIQYNLTIQRDLGHGTVFSLGYVGSQGVHLFSQQDMNSPLYCSITPLAQQPTYCPASPAGSPGSATNPFTGLHANPTFGGVNIDVGSSHSTYNGLEASLNRQISHNLQGQVSYTYSRCIDNGSVSYGYEQGGYETTDPYNPRYDRGPCTFNITQTLRVNGLYALPFRGNRLVSGWQVAPIFSADTGLPFNLINSLNPLQANLGSGGIEGDRPNYASASGCSPNHIVDQIHFRTASNPSPYVQWFDPTCYTLQPLGTLGNMGRNSIPGPGHLVFDFSIMKDTKITEGLTAQFRAEFFNIINHTNFGPPLSSFLFSGARGALPSGGGLPATVFYSPTAGQISTTGQFTSRQIQFALKLIF